MLISGSLPETIHQMITNPDTQGGWLERLAKLGADGLVEDLNRMVERGSVEGFGVCAVRAILEQGWASAMKS
jgi:hypothetical protein